MAESSDNDDLPDLVESSDEDSPVEKKAKKTNADLAKSWLSKGSKFMEKQEMWMRIFSLCPFLFGINNILSAAWTKALFTAKLLLNEKRQYDLTYLEWQEWECLDLMDHIIPIVQDKMRKGEVLFHCLDCVDKLDGCKKGLIIDVDLAIQEAKKYEDVSDLWTDVLKDQVCNGKEMAARFGVLYVIKLYYCHVISIEVNGKDFVEEKKREYKNSNTSKRAEEFKKKGNECYSHGKYKESIECYTDACKTDPFHHIYFGNRAQAYNKLRQFQEALADGRRAVTIKPDFSKGHYRYSQAFYELGQLEAAIRVNKRGLKLCEKTRSTDVQNVKDLEEQGEKFWQARQEGTSHHQPLTSIPKDLEKKLDSIVDSGDSIDLNKKFGVQEPPRLDQLTDSDSDCQSTPGEAKNKKRTKSRSQRQEKEKSKKDKKSKQEKEKSKQEKFKEEEERKRIEEYIEERAKLPPPSFEVTENALRINEILKTPAIGLLPVAHTKQINKTRFKDIMAEGSEALLKNVNKVAISSYKRTLDVIALADDLKIFGMDSADVLTLKYAYGMAAVSTGIHKNILEGMEKFREILDVNIRYPMAYYGLGKAYITMNRFILALQKLQEGYSLVEKINKGLGINRNCEFWPGTKTVIEESDPKNLKNLLEDLIQLCHFPPPPDGICRHHTDKGDTRTDIYRSDPDFKGLYQIFCEMGCIVSYHPNCWKDFKGERNTSVDKDILDTDCVTPDCTGLIIKILIERDLDTKKEHISEKHTAKPKLVKEKKPVVKMKSTSDHKLAKKKDRKDLRKQRRRERLEEKDDLIEDRDERPPQLHIHVPDMTGQDIAEAAEVFESGTVVHPLPDEKKTVVLKKEEIEINKQVTGKHKKNRKKKDKSKQLLTLEVNFSDRKEETLLGENSVIEEENKEKVIKKPKPTTGGPGLVPTPKTAQIPTGNGHTIPVVLEKKTDEITENVMSYFSDFLKVQGPLAIDDTRIQQELEVFPLEAQEKIKAAGGLGDFLRQDFKFAVIDDVVSLMTDAVKARAMALARRDERVNQGKQPQVQDTWKTVGKDKDVDSLMESVPNTALNTGRSSYVSALSNNPGKTQYTVVAQTKDLVDQSGKHTSSLANSNSSNSINSIDSSTLTMKHLSDKASDRQSESSLKEVYEKLDDISVDALDSIDDFPLPKTMSEHEAKSKLDDLDDFDIYPDTASSVSDKGSERSKKGISEHDSGLQGVVRSRNSISDSSSDISETSDISVEAPKLAVGGMPRPLQPLNRFGPGFAPAAKIGHENDFKNVGSPNLDSEIKRLADNFIKRSDEKLMSEIADSVVKKIYSGKSVSDVERANTLRQVSDDIRKDFERSAKSGGSGIWANTPASADYSNNIGKFATDFMKSHYQKENIVFSPTSDPSSTFFQNSSSVDSNNLNSKHEMTSETGSETRSNFSSTINPSSSSMGYNLFSGPSLGLDSIGSPRSSSPQLQRLPQPFIRPPPAAASYYSHVPPPVPVGPRPPLTPLRMPSFHAVLKIDKETQVVSAVNASVETMTEPLDMVEIEMYLQVKDDFERMTRETARFKEKITADVRKLEGKNKEQHNEITASKKKMESAMKTWAKEKESLQDVIKNLREQLAKKQKSEAELKKDLLDEEMKFGEMIALLAHERDEHGEEIERLQKEAELHKINCQRQTERAKTAEIEILKSNLAGAAKMLERSQKEAMFHIKNLEGFIKKHEEMSKPVPAPLKQSLDHWKAVAQKSGETLTKIKSDYESQISDVSNGKQMSELSPINIPSPPPVPDSVKSFMMISHPNNMQFARPNMMPGHPQGFGPRPPLPNAVTQGNARLPAPETVSGPRPEYSITPATSGPSTVPKPQSPAPLRPLQGAAGLVPPRPLSGARPPLVTPGRAAMGPSGIPSVGPQAPKTSFEKLILKLQMDFPNHNRNDFNQYIQSLRQSRGGSLSGMSMQDIITQVSQIIAQHDQHKSKSQGAESSEKPVAPPPGISASWAFPTSGSNNNSSSGISEMYQEDEDPCAICHEELTVGNTQTLECAHKFHDECIRKWFREQSTCPNCRVHSLLSDEFPSLG